MKYLYIGKIVNTHGIKGEVRILSNFSDKKEAFKIGRKVYIGETKQELILHTYRVHKQFDMVTFENIDNINDVLMYKGKAIYVNRDDLEVDGYLEEDMIGLEVYTSTYKGMVTKIMDNKAHPILVIQNEQKIYYVPLVEAFIEKVDIGAHKLWIKDMKGLFDED